MAETARLLLPRPSDVLVDVEEGHSPCKRPNLASFGGELFVYNHRDCCGNSFHKHILENDEEAVKGDLAEDESVLHARYGFLRCEGSRSVLCTGTGVHLAAGRRLVSMLKLLLEHQADCGSRIEEGGLKSKSLMHVAIYGEGKGGTPEMLDLLCQRGLSLTEETMEGFHGLHLAFQSGNMETIQFVQGKDCSFPNGRVRSPLEMGIKYGRMTQDQLVKAAPPTASSLKSFIHHASECIPKFLKNRRIGEAHQVGKELQRCDILRLLRVDPQSAVALFEKLTTAQHVNLEDWREQRSLVVNDVEESKHVENKFSAFYSQDIDWKEWKGELQDFKDPPIIMKCHIPNMISPSFFWALLENHGSKNFMFDNITVRAAISYVFWHGAIWTDVTQFILSFWGLLVLIFETSIVEEYAVDAGLDSGAAVEGVFSPSFGPGRFQYGVVADWVIAKGIVDLLMEMAQMYGCYKMGDKSAYLNMGNLMDLFRSLVPISLLLLNSHRVVHLLIVLIYWSRLLEGITYYESFGLALLPLSQLASGLLPATMLTLFGFFAFTHAMYTVQMSPTRLWDTLWSSFSMLITQGLPETAPADNLEVFMLYGGVLFFSVFMLNIFIGVISEQYAQEKEQAHLAFQRTRASSCLTFLLRAYVAPTTLFSRRTAWALTTFWVIVVTGLQVAALLHGFQLPGLSQLFAFLLCQAGLLLSSMQSKNRSFPWNGGDAPDRYLWVCQSPDAQRLEEGEEEAEVSGEVMRFMRRTISAEFHSLNSQCSYSDDDDGRLIRLMRMAMIEALDEHDEQKGKDKAPDPLPTLLERRFNLKNRAGA